MTFTIAKDADALAEGLADRLIVEAWAAWAQTRRLRIALAGGSTPRGLYEALGRRAATLPWQALEIFFSDERAVGAQDPASNYRLASLPWLSKAPPGTPIHRIRGELGAQAAADAYDLLVRRAMADGQGLDIVLLGFGPDGHIASLFPEAPLAATRAAEAVPATADRIARITLTLPALVASHRRIILAQGPAKAEALRASLAPGAKTPLAELLARAPVEFWLDRAAGQALCAEPGPSLETVPPVV
ncbi:6-phosphogluconolactonase [Acidiferrobacter sp.]|uniref:6-phosphogluconolactonase n=1 Tax=Acidiferrobacter sp. TaxID=1872107 RepID=UPI00261A7EB0|nr:6-phosphogluconolactonase [Acidiferrobacter sp.]